MNLEALRERLRSWWGLVVQRIEPLPGDGSARTFLRLHLQDRESLILILPQPGDFGLREARSYFLLGRFLWSHGIPVPEILAYQEPEGVLLVEDLGKVRLWEHPERNHFYPQALEILVALQELAPWFPKEAILETPFYDARLIWEREILYFETWYLQRYRGRRWLPEERARWQAFLNEALFHFTDTVVLHRDFQSRNLMIKGGRLYLIDFQAARLGPPSYDLASLLYDPYVEDLPRKRLLEIYLRLSGRDRETLFSEMHYTRVFRLLQALGAFVKLSCSGKPGFKEYIPRAEKRLWKVLSEDLKETLP
ncbi:aminoglycoside phosphotransferase family protein [Thermosulfurimonas marina]|nr:phosphotransferase [Thermosulfurimonas marina]